MKILFLTNHLKGTDGWSRYSLDYIKEIQKLGHRVLVLTFQKSEQKEIRECAVLEEPSKYLASPLKSCLTSLKVKKMIKRFSPDVIHFMVEPYATFLPFLKANKIKTVLTVHGSYSVIPILFKDFLKRKISRYLSKNYYKKLDRILADSNYTKKHLIKYYPELKTKIKVVTNGVNLEEHKIINLSEKPENKIKKIIFVGAIKPRKGVLEAVKACKYYQDHFSKNFIFEVVGNYNSENKYYQKVLMEIKDHYLEKKIFFRGRVAGEELEEYYFKADLFLMPSINIDNQFEGFGLVYLEANAKGIPCIGSKNSGAKEAILDGKTGYLVNPYNPKEIAEKIDLILNKETIQGENCIEWAKKNDIKVKVREVLNFYQTL